MNETAKVFDKKDGRHARGDRRRRAVIDAARSLFLKHGYRGTTLDAIIAQAGGSRETIYRTFGGKRGLFGAIVDEVGTPLADSVLTPAALELPPREGLTRLARELLKVWRTEEGVAVNRMVLSEGLDAPDLVDSWYRGGIARSVSALSQYLEVQHDAGRLQALDPALTARQFIMLLIGEVSFPLIATDAASCDADVQITRCVDVILRAYENTPSDERHRKM